jgi:hypothetical protein
MDTTVKNSLKGAKNVVDNYPLKNNRNGHSIFIHNTLGEGRTQID